MSRDISPQCIAELMCDNLINTYTDYCYIVEIANKLKPKGVPIIAQSWNDYCCCIKEIIEMIQRDLVNCLYKLLCDRTRGSNFEKFLDAFNVKNLYSNYTLLNKNEIKMIKSLRNQYIGHINPSSNKLEVDLKVMQPQIKKLIEIYNNVVKVNSNLKLITDKDLQRIDIGTRNGVSLMFNNETHKILYE